METIIRPFSFREYLRHRGEEPKTPPAEWTPAERSNLEHRFRGYLSEGGFPETQNVSRSLRVELLQGYVDTVLFRDILERYAIPQVAVLRWLVRHALRNPAGLFSAHRLYLDLKAQGYRIGKETVHALLGHVQDAFLVSMIPLATTSERQRNANPQKIFPVNPGLIGAFDTSGRANIGHALETVVFNELEGRKAAIGYVKTADGYEVDFHARTFDGEMLVQVCADPTSQETRELRALQSVAADYPNATRQLLVLTHEQVLSVTGNDAVVQPVYDWLLST